MSFTLGEMLKLAVFSNACLLSDDLNLDDIYLKGITILDNDYMPSKDYENKLALTNLETLINIIQNQIIGSYDITIYQCPVFCVRCSEENISLLKMEYDKIREKSIRIIILPLEVEISSVITSVGYEIFRTSNYNIKYSYEENYFQEIIFSCNPKDYESYVEKANMLGLRLDEHIGLILIKPNDLRTSNDIHEFLKNKRLNKTFLLSKNDIILMIVQTSVINDIDLFLTKYANDILNMLLSNFTELNFNIGIGNCYSDIYSLRKSFYEARVALTMNIVYENTNNILKFKELGIYSIIFSYENKESLYYFYFKYLGHIREFDKENDTEYFNTLISLIDNQFSINKTSKVLYIHYNTVLNRIRNIKELFQLDIDNQDCRINVSIANTIYKFLNEDNNIFD